MFDTPSILKALRAAKSDADALAILDRAIQARTADQILVSCNEAFLPGAGHRFTGYHLDGQSIILRGPLPPVGTTHVQDGITYFIASHHGEAGDANT